MHPMAGLRLFIVEDDEGFRRFPVARLERLTRAKPDESCPQFAGRRVRYALLFLELENRRPERIVRAEYGYLTFDDAGRLDSEQQDEAARIAASSVDTVLAPLGGGGVIDGRDQFLRRRLGDFRWEPEPRLESAIFQAALSS